MQIYELGYLILPSLAEDRVLQAAEAIKSLVSANDGRVFAGEDPIKIDLAYTMSKTVGASKYVVNEAYIGWVKFELEPEKLGGVKVGVEKMNEVLRFLLIKAPKETSFTFTQSMKKALEVAEESSSPEAGVEEKVAVE